MEDLLFRVEYPVITSSSEVGFQDNSISSTNGRVSNSVFHTPVNDNNMFRFEIDDNLIKTQILNHPRYPDLVAAFIDCQKVGAPAEMGYLLEEINLKNFSVSCCSEIGADPELDYFMESYCEILHRYKEELSKTFNEATAFLKSIESQLSDLCKESFTLSIMDYRSDEAAGTSEEELSCGEVEVSESVESIGVRSADEELKVMLLKKYSGYLSSLRKEFLHKRKRGKLPKDSRTLLMDWWNSHYRWPYPTEEEKQKLSDETGLDQKQINNWFINQRKRHWKPSEDMRSVLTQTVRSSSVGYGNSNTGPPFFDQ